MENKNDCGCDKSLDEMISNECNTENLVETVEYTVVFRTTKYNYVEKVGKAIKNKGNYILINSFFYMIPHN